ncbi:MAG: hypothetical protein ACI35P_01660 [Bacillus sp. (in: firmicutes)]
MSTNNEQQETGRVMSEAEKKQRSRRNLKLYTDTYCSVSALAQCLNMTQNDLIKVLIDEKVPQLTNQQREVYGYLKDTVEARVTK